jgi:amino acid transporter
MYGMGRENVVPRIFSRTHHSRRTPWVAIIATTLISIVILVIIGEGGVDTLASATVAFLLAVFSMVCFCGTVLRRDDVDHDHYRAPIALLWLGVVVNLALLGYVVFEDLKGLIAGEIPALESTSVVCGVLIAVGLVLYFVNNIGQRKLDPADAAPASDGPRQDNN